MRCERIVIIGAGPAGVSAAGQCARFGVPPCLLDSSGQAGGLIANAWRIENLAGVSPIDGPTMAARLREHLARFDLTVEPTQVKRVIRDSGGLVVAGVMGGILARAVILAPGTRPLIPEIPGLSSSNARVFFEVRDLLQQVPRPTSAIVVGGGEAAFDYALSLAAVGAEVTVVMRGRKPKACARLVGAVAREPAVTALTEATPLACAEGAASVTLDVGSSGGTSRLSAECIVVAVGRVSRAPDLLDSSLGTPGSDILPFPGLPLFIVGDARHGGLGQLAMAYGDGVAAAARAVAAST